MSMNNAAYYITKNIDLNDIHIATFYDIRGNYISTVNLQKSEHGLTSIKRLDHSLNPDLRDKIIFHSIVIEYEQSKKILKYCDKNTNIILQVHYLSELPITKENLRKYTLNSKLTSIFDKRMVQNGDFAIVDNSQSGYYCLIC